jgi:hypothetical protein
MREDGDTKDYKPSGTANDPAPLILTLLDHQPLESKGDLLNRESIWFLHALCFVRTMTATAVATVTATQVVLRREDHRFSFPIVVFTLDQRFWPVYRWILIASEHLNGRATESDNTGRVD